MRKGGNIKRFFNAVAMAVVLALLLNLASSVTAGSEENRSYLEKAKADAEKARAEAAKAMAEAEAAIAEAEAAMANAEKAKAKAKEEKEAALEKMVGSGYFPDDFAMTTPDGSTTAIFSHKKHTERERLRCIECHPNVFLMKVGKDVVKRGSLDMASMQKGRYCGNCHNGDKAFSVSSIEHCKRCHPKSANK